MKKILFILFATQFILAPYIIKSYGANLIEDNYEYSGVNQGRKTGLSLKPWGIALKFLFLHHENILFPND